LSLQQGRLSPLGDDPAVPVIGVKSQLIVLKFFNVSGTTGALTFEDFAK
jgi:hypothetical protein